MPRPTYVNANVNRANYDSAVPIPWVDAGGSNILGGSWWDAAYTANGSTHWASETVTDTDTVKAVNFNVTTLFQAIYDNPNHLSAVIVCNNSANVAIYAGCGNSNSALRPVISYDGGSAIAITENTAVGNGSFAGIPNGSTQNISGDLGTGLYERLILNVPPPTTRPTSATLTLTTTAQFGTTAPLIFWLRYPPESAPSAITYTYARPASDITTQWTPSTAGPHYALIDEVTYNDADYIYATAAAQTDEVGLQAMSIPTAGTDVLVNYRVQGITGGGSVTVSLYSGATLVKTDTTRTANNTSPAYYTMTVTAAEWGAVAVNWSNMRLRFVSA
jgi:hypothetical protein